MNVMYRKSLIFLLVALLTIALLSGCTSLWQSYGGERRGVSSSLVDYLYPGGEPPPPVSDSIPRLELPLRVGLAFVPSAMAGEMTYLSEATKTDLLQRVREKFLDRDYIAAIEVIPETYLRSGKGFSTLDQVSRLYNLDVIALVSYDQVVATDDTTASFLYWTIIGAYLVEGSKNDVQTFVDTAVFDVPTRRLLLRAPGTDHIASKSTLVGSNEEVRENRTQGFRNAIDDMTQNLIAELDRFEVRLKEEPGVVEVVAANGGGGSLGPVALLVLLLVGLRPIARALA